MTRLLLYFSILEWKGNNPNLIEIIYSFLEFICKRIIDSLEEKKIHFNYYAFNSHEYRYRDEDDKKSRRKKFLIDGSGMIVRLIYYFETLSILIKFSYLV